MLPGIGIPAESMFRTEGLDHIHSLFLQEIHHVRPIAEHRSIVPDKAHPFAFEQRQVRVEIFSSHDDPLRFLFRTGSRKRQTKNAENSGAKQFNDTFVFHNMWF